MNMSLLRAANSALRLIAPVGLTLGIVTAQPTTPSSDSKSEEPQRLEKYEVTGSRIKRTDAETPQPVVTFTFDSVQNSGYRTLGEFVQSLPFNSGSANSIFQGSSFTRGAVTANPRGLGSNRFLVLVNGRRAVTYALTQSNNNSIFDFNSIPEAAIDRIEWLKDGASAIYGSDAITGVMNVILKKNYTGLSTDVRFENTLGHDSLQKQASVLAGAQTGKTAIMAVVNYQGGNSTYIKDYSRSKTTDYSRLSPKGINQNSSANWPANVNLTASQAAAAGFTTGSGLYVLTGGVPTANPTKSQFARVSSAPNANRYDFAQVYQLFPDYDYYDAFVRMTHDFTDRIQGFAEISYNNHITKYGFTPAVIQSTQNPGTGPTGLLNVPATNPYNPFGIDLTNFLYRTNFGPPRKFDTESNGANYLAGLRGQLSSDWSWELGTSYGYSEVTTVSRNQIRAADLQAALNGTTRQTALNPFGPSDNQSVVTGLFTISNSSAKASSYGTDLRVEGRIPRLELPGGEIGVATGAELRKDKLDTRPDTASYVGQGGGLPLTGNRTVKSAFAELDIPVIKQFEVQVAGRHEDYSDFGRTDKPKVGAKLVLPKNPYVNIIVRGSYSKSFKAPDLGRLYATQTVGFSSTLLQDPLRPQDPPTQMRIVTGGNPTLKPELGTVKYMGVVLDPGSAIRNEWIRNLSLSVDYFDYSITNVINTPSSTFLLSQRGREQFPGAIVRDNSTENPGPIRLIQAIPVNVALQFYKGYDFDLEYQLKNTRIGSFKFHAQATYITDIGFDNGFGAGVFHNVGLYNNPRFVGTIGTSWRYKDWGADVNVGYYGHYFNDGYTAAGWGENSKTVANPSISYRGNRLWGVRVTIGSSNVFNTQPPLNGYETLGFDPNTVPYGNLALGRTIWVRISKDF